jgi:hypothetical protein
MSSSSDKHWQAIYRQGPRIGPPLVVDDEVAAAYQAAIAGHRGSGLLLGATPRLADFTDDVTAVERNRGVIEARWPGDTPHRRAVLDNWHSMRFPAACFGVAIGDGSLNVLSFPDEIRTILGRVAEFLRPGAPVAIRAYLRPEDCEPVAAVFAAVRAREIRAFSAFKWRLAMAMCHETGKADIAVADIHRRFVETVADRAAFALETGIAPEEIAAIDVYGESREVYSFPTPSGLVSAIPPALRFIRYAPSGSYELAGRCPIAVLERI